MWLSSIAWVGWVAGGRLRASRFRGRGGLAAAGCRARVPLTLRIEGCTCGGQQGFRSHIAAHDRVIHDVGEVSEPPTPVEMGIEVCARGREHEVQLTRQKPPNEPGEQHVPLDHE